MLESMTGFGQAEKESDDFLLKVEIKTLNSKFLDLNLKTPRELSSKETEIRNLIQRVLKRGKINVQIELSARSSENQPLDINEDLLKAYYSSYQRIAKDLNDDPKDLFRLALHSPDVLSKTENGTELDWAFIESVFKEACVNCQNFRLNEGTELAKKLSGYIDTIGSKLKAVEKLDANRIANIRSRIDKNLDEIRAKVQVDENRFEQELIFYIEKLDITEEKVRLGRHLDYFKEVIDLKESQGKKLGFISQEIGREINTLGSKANDADVQQLVVEMKDELEKIKEQLLNII